MLTERWAPAAKRWLPASTIVRLRCLLRSKPRPHWGNLRRTTPFSTCHGFDRGTPVDRFYLHRFLGEHRHLITGDVLEVQVDSYTRRFGHDLRKADTFDIITDFRPTYLCDLAHSEGVLPSAGYDCIVLPNTLPHLRELDSCLHHLLRVVRPGGVILASAGGFIPLTADVPDYWRLSPDGWRELLQRVWSEAVVEVMGHGNCLAAVAALYGLALEELAEHELEAHDPRYPVLTTIVCRKARQ